MTKRRNGVESTRCFCLSSLKQVLEKYVKLISYSRLRVSIYHSTVVLYMTNDLSLLKSWPESQTIANDLRSRILAGKSFHNCYLGLGSVWQVKLFLGGEQRIVAQARNSNLERAIRFADMAIAYFAPYRKRRNRPLLDSDFNLNVNQANADLHNIPEAVKFLQTLL